MSNVVAAFAEPPPMAPATPSPSPTSMPPAPSRSSTSSKADVASLALHCGRSLVEHLQGAAEDLDGAGALANDAMAMLRRHCATALAANTQAADPAECRRHLEAAMAASQCEDALGQVLDSLQHRLLQLVDVMRYVVMPRSGDADAVQVDGGLAGREDMAARLRLAVVAMDAGIDRSSPVVRQRAVADTVASS